MRATKLSNWALFWADGQRTVAEIAALISSERKFEIDPQQVAEFFEAHEALGYVKFSQ